MDQHQKNTNCQAQIVIADHKHGTTENFVECQARCVANRLDDLLDHVLLIVTRDYD